MPFTGKATYTAGVTLPEIAEDVSDLVSINSPHETPLLDALGDASRVARSTVHEWLEDELLPNEDVLTSANAGQFVVENIDRFRGGDQVQIVGSSEIVLVTAVDAETSTLTVTRSYGGTLQAAQIDGRRCASSATRRWKATMRRPHASLRARARPTTRRFFPRPSK